MRSILRAPFPILVHCVAGRDRTGVVIALLQLLAGSSRIAIIFEYCLSLRGVEQANIEGFLDSVGDPYFFLLSCGLSDEEITRLRERILLHDAPYDDEISESANNSMKISQRKHRQFEFLPGSPPTPCRPFHPHELLLMKKTLMLHAPTQLPKPIAVIITGLPASGKLSVSQQALLDLGLNMNDFVNIDMDLARSFHAQYQLFSCGRSSSGGKDDYLQSYMEIVPWFNKGSNIEFELYSNKEGLVPTLREARCNFLLATVMDNPRTLKFLKQCVLRDGYDPILIGVHTSTKTSLSRARERNSRTGRYTPPELIEGREGGIQSSFIQTTEFVRSVGGIVRLYDNDQDGTSQLKLVFSYDKGGKLIVRDQSVAQLYMMRLNQFGFYFFVFVFVFFYFCLLIYIFFN